MAISVYGVPFAGLLCGVLLAAVLGLSDVQAVIAGVIGLSAAGFSTSGLTRYFEQRTLAELERFSDADTSEQAAGSDRIASLLR